MKPEVDQILGLSAGQLMGAIAPQLPTVFAQGAASLLGFMMMFAAQEYDRAAEIRAAENEDMRALFAVAASLVAEPELKTALAEASGLREGSLKISALNDVNHALRRTLIRLQVYAEEQEHREIARFVWDVLKRSADRRLLRLA